MKKIFFSIAIASSFILGSCGKSACECKKDGEELMKKVAADPSKAAELEKEAEALKEKCKDFKEEDYKDCK